MITIKDIGKKLEKLQGRNDWHSVLKDVFEVCAISLANQFDFRKSIYDEREKKYQAIIQKYEPKEVELIGEIFANLIELYGAMVNNEIPFSDYLGELYMYSGTSNKGSGQFFTPYCVSKTMAKLSMNEKIINNKIITLHEPTCGSGGLVLAGAETLHDKGINYADRLLVVCGDIEERCVHMTYLQLGLSGVPAIVLHQDALMQTTWGEWHTPALCLNYLRFRKTIKYVRGQMTPEEKEEYLKWLNEDAENSPLNPQKEQTLVIDEPQKENANKEEKTAQNKETTIKKGKSNNKTGQLSLFDIEF